MSPTYSIVLAVLVILVLYIIYRMTIGYQGKSDSYTAHFDNNITPDVYKQVMCPNPLSSAPKGILKMQTPPISGRDVLTSKESRSVLNANLDDILKHPRQLPDNPKMPYPERLKVAEKALWSADADPSVITSDFAADSLSDGPAIDYNSFLTSQVADCDLTRNQEKWANEMKQYSGGNLRVLDGIDVAQNIKFVGLYRPQPVVNSGTGWQVLALDSTELQNNKSLAEF